MSSTVHIDRIRTLRMVERPKGDDGAQVVEMTRVARLTAILDSGGEAHTTFAVLQQALVDLAAADGSWAIGVAPTGHPNLICVEREANLVPNEPDKVDITARWEWKGTTLDSLGMIDTDGDWIARGAGSLRQITTQNDKQGNELAVSFTYPGNYEDVGLRGVTANQVADMHVSVPSDSLSFEGRMRTNTPGVIARMWRNKTNSATWQGDPPGTWLCTDVSFDEYDSADTSKTYTMVFSFMFDELEWDPDAWFRDMRTGRRPVGLVQGTGIYEVPWYSRHDFNVLFPSS